MVNMRATTVQEELIIEVVEQMEREKRKPAILAHIQHSAIRQVSNEDVRQAITKLLVATNEDEGVSLTPWEAITLMAYVSHLELTIRGERYR